MSGLAAAELAGQAGTTPEQVERFEPVGEISLRGVAAPLAPFRALIRDSSPGG
jgi:hypothetical protein